MKKLLAIAVLVLAGCGGSIVRVFDSPQPTWAGATCNPDPGAAYQQGAGLGCWELAPQLTTVGSASKVIYDGLKQYMVVRVTLRNDLDSLVVVRLATFGLTSPAGDRVCADISAVDLAAQYNADTLPFVMQRGQQASFVVRFDLSQAVDQANLSWSLLGCS